MTKTILDVVWFFCGGGRGIRTPATFQSNGFQDRRVMTTSLFLQYLNKNVLTHFYCCFDILA